MNCKNLRYLLILLHCSFLETAFCQVPNSDVLVIAFELNRKYLPEPEGSTSILCINNNSSDTIYYNFEPFIKYSEDEDTILFNTVFIPPLNVDTDYYYKDYLEYPITTKKPIKGLLPTYKIYPGETSVSDIEDNPRKDSIKMVAILPHTMYKDEYYGDWFYGYRFIKLKYYIKKYNPKFGYDRSDPKALQEYINFDSVYSKEITSEIYIAEGSK